MRNEKKLLAILLLSVVSLSQVISLADARPQKINVLIGFKQTPGRNEQALVKSHGGAIKYSYHLVPAIAANLPEPAIKALLNNPNVTRVEPDGMVYAVDTELENSWGVERIGSGTVHDGDDGNKGTGVKVAIVDSGVNYTHTDLDDRFDPLNRGYDFVDDDSDPMDVYGHGTHVAGTACAEDNGFGVVGVAPECALYALRVLDANGVGKWSDIIAAMEWAVDNGMQVANLSLGHSLNPGELVKTAFDNAETAGVLIIAAAGNDGNPPGKGDSVIYPARYDSVIAVAATDSSDERPKWSSTGEQVELAAPGVSIYSTWNDDTDYYGNPTTCTNDDINDCYKYGSGTSMASPHVAGTAALVILANSDWSNDQVRAQLQNTAEDLGDLGRDPKYGFGLVNAAEAVGAEQPELPPESSGTMHISSIEMGYETKGINRFIYTQVSVVDENGTAVSGATVDLTTTLNDNLLFSGSGETNSNGEVVFQFRSKQTGTYISTVENVTKEGWDYDPGANKPSYSLPVE